jgi:hypothetical protein
MTQIIGGKLKQDSFKEDTNQTSEDVVKHIQDAKKFKELVYGTKRKLKKYKKNQLIQMVIKLMLENNKLKKEGNKND